MAQSNQTPAKPELPVYFEVDRNGNATKITVCPTRTAYGAWRGSVIRARTTRVTFSKG